MKARSLKYILFSLVLGCSMGIAVGLGIFTFHYAKGSSYFTDNPQACVNCHIMRANYDSWEMASHRLVSNCNGCHTPADSFGKYKAKAIHGIRHSWAFTSGNFHEPLRMKQDSLEIVEANCRACHSHIFSSTAAIAKHSREGLCISCHRDVGHMR